MTDANQCSFCGRPSTEAGLLVSGLDAQICANCIEQAHHILEEESDDDEAAALGSMDLPKPAEIRARLDEYVIGQDDAKKILSVAVYNHYKRVLHGGVGDEDLEKSNVIMVGETGTGKTLLARTIARMLKVPFAIVDATVLTEAGYVGEDVESILTRLLQAADYSVPDAERGIVFIDEIDKIARKSDNPSITRDVSGEGVQQALLKLLEGAEVGVPPQGGRKHPEQKLVTINTRHILFICGGAFSGIETHIERRLRRSSLGFGAVPSAAETDSLLEHVAPADLKSYGLIPELIGRFPVLTHLDPLDGPALRRILTEPKNALIRQYVQLFELDGIALTFDAEALDFMVQRALEFKLGARGLRGICEAILRDAMFELPGTGVDRLHVDRAYAEGRYGANGGASLRVA